MTNSELKLILDLHLKWLNSEEGGVRADLKGADLYRADLKGANLKGANLKGANLYRADLQGADLEGADLEGANLEGANLKGADLRRADLKGANLSETNLDYQIEEGLLQKIAKIVLDNPETLNMSRWHNSCNTIHCIAGWACHLAVNGEELEGGYGTQIAGLLLLGAEAHSHFFDSNEDSLDYLGGVLK